jgi:hypothetical protein
MKAHRSMLVGVAIIATGMASFVAGFTKGQEKNMSNRVYELRTYTTLPGRLPALHKRFAEHTMKLFEKHGMKNEAYWVPTDERKDTTLIYVISHDSEEAAQKNWAAFQADPDWQKARAASEAEDAGGKILAKAPEKVFMKLTNYSPAKK